MTYKIFMTSLKLQVSKILWFPPFLKLVSRQTMPHKAKQGSNTSVKLTY